MFTGSPGKYVPLKETIRGFKMIVDGECDSLPEQAFYMVGTHRRGDREGEEGLQTQLNVEPTMATPSRSTSSPPRRSIFSGEAKFVALPGESGELGIYPRHTPLITRIKPGAVRIKRAGNGRGRVRLRRRRHPRGAAGRVTVLADTAIRGKDLDEAKATEAKRRAEDAMKNAKSDIDFAKAQGEFAAMAAQIAALRKYRRK